MADEEHLRILKSGVENWNRWRAENKEIVPNLENASLFRAELFQVNLNGVNLNRANLYMANLQEANLSNAYLILANLQEANLREANLSGANLTDANLVSALLIKANLYQAELSSADLFLAVLAGANLMNAVLTGANLINAVMASANLMNADLRETALIKANLSFANLTGANLSSSSCVETNFTNAIIENARIYGISIWNIQSEGLKQDNLTITMEDEPVVTVDNIEVAQFIYLVLNNQKLRDVIGTLAKKGVLILGRFTEDRKKILNSIRDKLREHDFAPIMFDFEKADERDFIETIKILAGMSRFVIADITNPRSSPMELQALIPDYKIPFITIIQKDEKPFSMFRNLEQYPWVLPPLAYASEAGLIKGFKKGIINEALNAEQKILEKKNAPCLPARDIEDFRD